MLEKLKKEAKEIQDYLDITCSENPEELQERIRIVMSLLSRTSFMLAEAKRYLRAKKSDEIKAQICEIVNLQYLSAKVQNALLDSIAKEESYLVDWLDRLNATATHQVDGLRSLLSYEKENLRLSQTGY